MIDYKKEAGNCFTVAESSYQHAKELIESSKKTAYREIC